MPKKTDAREVLGFAKCHDCAAKVEVRVDKGGMLYYRCDTSVDAKGCNGWHRYGPRLMREMKAKVAAEAPAPSDDFQVAKDGDDGVLAEKDGDGEGGDGSGGDDDGGFSFV